MKVSPMFLSQEKYNNSTIMVEMSWTPPSPTLDSEPLSRYYQNAAALLIYLSKSKVGWAHLRCTIGLYVTVSATLATCMCGWPPQIFVLTLTLLFLHIWSPMDLNILPIFIFNLYLYKWALQMILTPNRWKSMIIQA